MQLCRVLSGTEPLWASAHGGQLYALEGDRFSAPRRGRELGPLATATLLPPIDPRNKVVGMLANWGDRAGREGPGIFFKPQSALIGQDETILLPRGIDVAYEAELGVVLGRRARNVSAADALGYVLGYTVANDVTCSGMYKRELGFRQKSFDTFGPLGPWIVTGLDPASLRLKSRLNGESRQDLLLDGFAFSVAEVIAWVTSFMTLEPGDVLSMGSPPGIAQLSPGDIIECEISGVGTLRNPVALA